MHTATDSLGNPVTLHEPGSLAALNDFVEGFIACEARAVNVLAAEQEAGVGHHVTLSVVGAERLLTLREGGEIRERLLGFSEFKRTVVYSILSSPLPISDYVATLRVTPVTMGEKAFIEWWSRFEAAPADREAMVNRIRGVYEAGIEALAGKLAG